MIDTLHLAIRVELNTELFDDQWAKNTKEWKTRDHQRVKRAFFARQLWVGTALVHLKYHPQDYLEQPLLYVEISSVPKILGYPDGYLLDDISPAIRETNRTLRTIDGFPNDLDIWKGIIRRIDYCFQFDLGEDINSYVDVISHLNYPYRRRDAHANDPKRGKDNGVCFSCKSSRCTFYDKGLDTSARDFFGVLRMESSLRTAKAFNNAFGVVESPKLYEISNDMLKALLLKDLHILGLDLPKIFSIDRAFEVLKKRYGSKKAFVLKDTLEVLSNNTVVSIKKASQYLGVGKSTVYERIKEIKSAGLVPALNTSGKTLRPLSEFLMSELFPDIRLKSVVIPGKWSNRIESGTFITGSM